MENLELPLLRELFLHRNSIAEIAGLNGCPRIRRLWVFQNQLTRISGLHALPELEELWLQANHIRSLAGLEHVGQLASLGLAGNPLQDLQDLRALEGCARLRELSLSDIHFGRAPVADCEGYREFATLHLRQVRVLDGVKVSKEAQAAAEDLLAAQASESAATT